MTDNSPPLPKGGVGSAVEKSFVFTKVIQLRRCTCCSQTTCDAMDDKDAERRRKIRKMNLTESFPLYRELLYRGDLSKVRGFRHSHHFSIPLGI